jgi:hypothetical protein
LHFCQSLLNRFVIECGHGDSFVPRDLICRELAELDLKQPQSSIETRTAQVNGCY